MGMYTELHFNSELKKEIPASILNVLAFMVGIHEDEPKELPKHKLFNTTHWQYMLRTNSYSFDADTISTLKYDDISDSWYLCIRTNFKNYDSKIEHFIDWVMPYLNKYVTGEFLGFYRYEEDEQPTLIYYKKEL